jgi:hypothetical protein
VFLSASVCLQESAIDITHAVKNGKRTVKGGYITGGQRGPLKHVNVKGSIVFEGSKMYIKEFICALMMVGWKIKITALNSARHPKNHNV